MSEDGKPGGISMGLAILIIGLALFIANHLLASFREQRAALMTRVGRPLYHSLFGLMSIVSLALIVWGYAEYRATGWVQIWLPSPYMRHVTIALMLIASILIAAYLIPSHLKARVKHPLLAATKTWAFAHLLSNGDLGSIILFGSLLAWAIYAFVRAKHRKDVALPSAPVGWMNDVFVVLVGVALFLALGYWFHPYAIGIPVFGR
jgi:uncharacterized membrane protein